MIAPDWFELMTAAMGNVATYYALFWTLISGYLVVAYTVGNKLMRNQTAFVILFACANLVIALGCIKLTWDVRHPKTE
jgi:hypothetical protein